MSKFPRFDPFPEGLFDVVVVGAGVVGCAVARRFALEGARTLIVEKAADILDGASKGNSAILHTGFDAPVGSLEQQCVAEGHRQYLELRDELGMPVLETGAMVLAWTDEQAAALDGLTQQALANGVEDVIPMDRGEILNREPNIAPTVVAGFLVPGEYVIDPWTTPFIYLLQALQAGATVCRSTTLTGGRFDGGRWSLQTQRGEIACTTVVNCAGLYGDVVDRALLGESGFEIRPRKGQFIVYDKAARRLLSTIVLPVPTESTKGVVVCPTIFGNVLVGPTAEEQESRNDASVDRPTLEMLRHEGERILPGLGECLITATYAGIRPATKKKEYRIRYRHDQNYCTVGGIRSTGLTSALGIASHVFQSYCDTGRRHQPVENCPLPPIDRLAEDADRSWQQPDNGGIVCHCELVTRREIERALSGPLAVRSWAGLKRRTRITMGRCQGFFCLAEVAEMTTGRLAEPIVPPTRQDEHGNVDGGTV